MLKKIKKYILKIKDIKNKYIEKFYFKRFSQKLMIIVQTLIIIEVLMMSIVTINNLKNFQDKNEVYKNNKFFEKDVDYKNFKDYNATSIVFVKGEKELFVTPYIIIEDKYAIKQKEQSGLSIAMNLEKEIDLPSLWVKTLNEKYIYEPVFKRAEPVLLNIIKENFIHIILIALIIWMLTNNGGFGKATTKEIVYPEDIDKTMNDLVGLDSELRNDIMQLKDMIDNSSKYIEKGISDLFNIMFSGPPGVGKSQTAYALAKELGIPLVIGTGNVETGFIGGGAATIKSLFKEGELLAYNNDKKTAIIFLDEAQSLLKERGHSREKWADDAANELLAQLDGVSSLRKVRIIFIVASNFDDSNIKLDEAMARRFKRKIYFRLPSKKERVEIIEYYLKKTNEDCSEIDSNDLAEISEGLSPAAISTIINEASLISVRENKKLSQELIFKAFEKNSIGHATRDITKEKDRERIIVHELGHFIAEYESGESKIIKISSEAISQYDIMGFVMNKQDFSIKTKEDLENEIIHLYGGFVAEELILNSVSTGAYNDIEKVTEILKKMVMELGMYSSLKINLNQLGLKNEEETIKILTKTSERLIKETEDRVKRNKDLILYLKDILLKEWVLSRDELFKYIEDFKLNK